MLPTVAAQRGGVAVGTTREDAADVFGEHFDDAFFTAYEDFDTEVDLSLLRSVGLVAGDGLSAVLSRVLEASNPPGVEVLIGLPAGTRHRDIAQRVLEAHPSVACTAVLRSGEHVLLRLEPATGSGPDSQEEILDLLEPTGSSAASSSVSQPVAIPTVRPVEAPSPPPRQRSPRSLVRVALAALIAVGVFVVLIALTLGARALFVSVVVVLVISQALVLVGIAHVVRQLRQLSGEMGDLRRREVKFREQMRRRTERIVQLQRRDLAQGQRTRSEVAQVRNRVTALGKLLGRAGAVSRHEHDSGPPPDDGA